MAEVIRAESAGFCMGVSRALHLLQRQEGKVNHLATLGPIIHNTQVLESLEEKGIKSYSHEEVLASEQEQHILIRAHGIPKEIEQQLQEKENIHLIDATCPKVKDAQFAVHDASKQGYSILLYGEQEHAEVKGLCSYADEVYVFSSLEELQRKGIDKARKYALVSQTTQSVVEFETIYEWLQGVCDNEILCINTICDATYIRQRDVLSLVDRVDAFVIVGGYSSGNTRRLAQIAGEHVFTVHIEEASELPLEQLKAYQRIGLSAGASTPQEYIDAVETVLRTL